METKGQGFIETERMDWLRAEVVNVAPELNIDDEPDYFVGRQLPERYQHLAKSVDQLSRQMDVHRNSARNAYETPKIVIGHVQEQDLFWPISLSFESGPSRIWPSYLSATWRVEQFDEHSRRLHTLRQTAQYDDEQDDGANLNLISTHVLRGKVYLKNVRTRPLQPAEISNQSDQLNFIARSIEAYERLLNEWSDNRSRSHRRIAQDVISKSIDKLFSGFPDEGDEGVAWPEF